MRQIDTSVLGKDVLPLVMKDDSWCVNSLDTDGILPWKRGDDRVRYANKLVKEKIKEQRQENREHSWRVYSICEDGTYTLMSNYGYSRSGIKRNEFRILKQ